MPEPAMLTLADITLAWVETWRETPDPWAGDNPVLRQLVGLPRQSYRERLDAPVRNVAGEVIPRIVLVRANLRRLGKPRVRPRIPA